METIVPKRKGQSIIREVVEGVLPFVGMQYFRRIFWRLATDLTRWNREYSLELLNGINANSEADLSVKVFSLIAHKENSEQFNELFGKVDDFELLRYRLYSLGKVFEKPKRVVETLNNHQRRVEWQLHRIYRARNSVVHSGQSPGFTSVLVVNAHDYFDQVFELSNELSSGPKGMRDYTSCFDYAEWLFKQYHVELKRTTEFNIGNTSSVIWKRHDVLSKADFF